MLVDTLPQVTRSRAPDALLLPAVGWPSAFLWLWSLPAAVLLALNVEGYCVVSDNMNSAQREIALLLGAANVVNVLAGGLLYVVARRLTLRALPQPAARWWWGIPAVVLQTAYLGFALWSVEFVLPQSVVAWIYPPERYISNQFSFAMLPLFLGVLQLSCATRVTSAGKALGTSIAMAIAAPVLLFLALFSVGDEHRLGVIAPITLCVVASVAMFVGIVRAVMLTVGYAQRWGAAAERAIIALIALVLPIGGLLVNRTIPFPVDFQAWEVYALVLVNAAVLAIAAWKHTARPQLSTNLLCATLPFSLYFFIVLLPYTPLAIFAVIFFGLGFLVLTPTLLFTLHVLLLTRSLRALPRWGHSRSVALASAVASFAVLPTWFVVRGLADKAALNAALAYVATPSIHGGDMRYAGDRTDLRRALASHRSYKNGIYYPLLSDFYAWLVFDNLVLPDPMLARLEQTFVGTVGDTRNHDIVRQRNVGGWFGGDVRDRTSMPRTRPLPHTVNVTDIRGHVEPIGNNGRYTLGVTLENTGAQAAEFRQTLALPPGVYVTGLRLQIGNALVPGRIFEKKTAQWVYAMIRDSERRDPALLVYTKPGEVELSVFPVDSGKPTHVELDLLTPSAGSLTGAPLQSNDLSRVLAWLDTTQPASVAVSDAGALFRMSSADGARPTIARRRYLHILVDRSEDGAFTGNLTEVLKTLQSAFPDATEARVTLVNSDIVDAEPALRPIDQLAHEFPQPFNRGSGVYGGLALDLAIAHALRQHRDVDLDSDVGDQVPPRPVFVLLSSKAVHRTLSLPISERWGEYCGGLALYEVDREGTLISQRQTRSDSALVRCGRSIRPAISGHAVLFAAGAGGDRIEYWSPADRAWLEAPNVNRAAPTSPWTRAAALQLEEQQYAANPGDGTVTLPSLVAASRESGVLLPTTGYIVVENAAQWGALSRSEQQKLGQNTGLEFREAPAPATWLVATLFGGALLLRSARRRVKLA